MRKVALSNLDKLFALVAESAKLYIPVDGKGGASYKLWEQGVVMSNALNTVRSAKDFFFPQTENLMEFKSEGLIFGTSVKLFSVVGPVVVNGIVWSTVAGLLKILWSTIF